MPRVHHPPSVLTSPPRQHTTSKINVLPANPSALLVCATKICLHDPKLFGLLMSIAGVSNGAQPGRLRLFAASLVTIVLGLLVSVGLVSSKRYLGLTVSTLGVYFFWNNFRQHPQHLKSGASTSIPTIESSTSTTSSTTIYSQLPVELQKDRPVSQVNSKIQIDQE